jgi:IS5 family transposase
LHSVIPDDSTLWNFCEQLKNAGLDAVLLDRFQEQLHKHGFAPKDGSIVDGMFVEVPRQRNTKEENAQIKQGEVPANFTANQHKQSQKDVDAARTKKGDENHFGYKNHILADVFWKIIRGYGVTTASVHDSNVYLDFYPEKTAKDKAKSQVRCRIEHVFGEQKCGLCQEFID